MTTPRVVATELDQLFSYLESVGIVHYWNAIDEKPAHVSWHSTSAEPFLLNHDEVTVSTYMYWLRNGMYSAVLTDGALLQISYFFDGSSVVGHRLAYVPCPVVIDVEMLSEGLSLEEVVELHISGANDVLMKAMVRFDYDPRSAGPRHPATHLTLNSVECRIACVSPLRVGRFIDFVFRNFYPRIHQKDPYLQGLTLKGWFKRSIVQDDADALHISWAS